MQTPIIALLDLPPLPERFISDLGSFARESSPDFYTYVEPRRMIIDGQPATSGLHMKWPIDKQDPMLDWIRTNIIPEWGEITWKISTAPRHGAHVDLSRRWVLQFLIDAGGDDVPTIFYEPTSQKFKFEGQCHHHVNDYTYLQETHRFVCPPRSWMILNATNIHSVENITGERRFLSVSLATFPKELSAYVTC